MVQRGKYLRFALESPQPVGIVGQVIGQHFNGHIAFQTRIVRKIDHPHAAAADLSLDFVRPNSLKMILIHATSLTAARYQVALKGFGNAVFVCFLRSESRSN